MTHYKRLSSFALVAIALLMVAVAASIGLMGHIDAKLKQSAEQQVITFTRQAAGNVADRVFVIQNALSVFTVQSADPEDVVRRLPPCRNGSDSRTSPSPAWTGPDATEMGLSSTCPRSNRRRRRCPSAR